MERPSDNVLEELIGTGRLNIWRDLTGSIDRLYDVDRIWNKGFGDWTFEYKYRRGGKRSAHSMQSRTQQISLSF